MAVIFKVGVTKNKPNIAPLFNNGQKNAVLGLFFVLLAPLLLICRRHHDYATPTLKQLPPG